MNGLTADACTECGWPHYEHELDTLACPDYTTNTGWLDTHYSPKDK